MSNAPLFQDGLPEQAAPARPAAGRAKRCRYCRAPIGRRGDQGDGTELAWDACLDCLNGLDG